MCICRVPTTHRCANHLHDVQGTLQNSIAVNGYTGADSLEFDTIWIMGLDTQISNVTIDDVTHVNWSQNATSNVSTQRGPFKSIQCRVERTYREQNSTITAQKSVIGK